MKILHCPKNWGGNPWGLVRAERKLGFDSRLIVFEKSNYHFKSDECIDDSNIFMKELKRWILFIKVIFRYDVIHLNTGTGIMPDLLDVNRFKPGSLLSKIYYRYIMFFSLRELPILKFFGKKIIVTYFGDDARQGEYCKKHFKHSFAWEVGKDYYPSHLEKYKRWKISKFDKYADLIYYFNPDLAYFLPKRARFLPYTSVFPIVSMPTHVSHKIPLIVHAPSDRLVKGTKYILDTVHRLEGEQIKFKFVLIEGISNKEAKKIYKKADLVIDQLLLGWYGTFAIEAMAYGKPVISYIRKEDLKFVPKEMVDELPIINANKDTLYDVLKEYLTDKKNLLPKIGVESKKYISKWHNPVSIAQSIQTKLFEKKRI